MKKTMLLITLSSLLAVLQTMGVDPETLKQADRVFAEQTAERGLDGWVDAFAPDGKLVSRGGVTEGHDAIRAAMGALDRSDFLFRGSRSSPKARVTWATRTAPIDVSASIPRVRRWWKRAAT